MTRVVTTNAVAVKNGRQQHEQTASRDKCPYFKAYPHREYFETCMTPEQSCDNWQDRVCQRQRSTRGEHAD